eukprot:4339078-Pyramimonas_sp.AAC.1
MKTAFGDRISKLEGDKDKDKDSNRDKEKDDATKRTWTPTPVAEPPDAGDIMGRPEVGWLQSIIGKKCSLPGKLSWGQATKMLEEAMKDKVVVGQCNKCIEAHFPRKQVPASKTKKATMVLNIINGSAI